MGGAKREAKSRSTLELLFQKKIPKIYLNAGADNKCFGISDSTENVEKVQCQKCNPPLSKLRGAFRPCADCRNETERTATAFFDNFRRHRKVIPLDRFCDNCEKPKTSAMMSKRFSICRQCADKLKTTTGAAHNRIIAQILNNIHKRLKTVAI